MANLAAKGVAATPDLYPMTFTPIFKDYPWGGRNLATMLGRTLPDGIGTVDF